MTFCIENESGRLFGFDEKKAAERVIRQALLSERCPYEVEINVLITDKKEIRAYNKEYRGIDSETDVLSFPGVDYDKPADFSVAVSHQTDYFNPDTGELMLGDIILCADRVFSQAEEFGHSILREFSFLIAHSVLHLLGYDHMESLEEMDMITRQNQILDALHITREKE